MRRILLTLAMLASLAFVGAPAHAHPSNPPNDAQIAARADAHNAILAENLREQGFTNITLTSTTHDHLLTASSPSWHRTPTLEYWFRIKIGIHHEVDRGDFPARWQPTFNLACFRSGGIANLCNFVVNEFRALGWKSYNGLTMKVYGTANPPNNVCVTSESSNGSWRSVEALYEYVGSELGYIQVGFNDNYCSKLHTSNVYEARSYRTAAFQSATGGMINFENDYTDSKSGLRTV
jgi:hypothetical protein